MKLDEMLLDTERIYWVKLLERVSWNVPGAAKLAGFNRTSAYKRIAKLGIRLPGSAPQQRRGNWGNLLS